MLFFPWAVPWAKEKAANLPSRSPNQKKYDPFLHEGLK